MAQRKGQVVTVEKLGNIALVAVDNPPVNALSHAVRAALTEAIEALDADREVEVVALYAEGRTFIAGADIREFGKPPVPPFTIDVCRTLENAATPIVAVIHGTTLGGGLEIALACHARVALDGTIVGFPEVTLGLIPGGGGTQRAPRVTGITSALDLITTGKRIGAHDALTLGLIDEIASGTPRDVAISSATAVLSGNLATRRIGQLTVTPDPDAIAAATDTLRKTSPHHFAPQKCVEAVAASTLPIEDGIAAERAIFLECQASPQRAALVHAFFAERAVDKIPEKGTPPRVLEALAVIGGGTMGSGITTAALLAGFPVTLAERDGESLEKGRAAIAKNLDGAVKRGKLSEARRTDILTTSLKTTTDLADLAGADLVIEAVFEDMAVKTEIFGALDRVMKPGAVLATNTSYLDIDTIAAATERPGDVIGLHFFSPAHIMRLLEVVVAQKTTADVVATGFALAKRLGKIAVRAGVCDGFIGNRIMSHYRKVGDYLVMDGASPEAIDDALEGFGLAMGPFKVGDLAGLDIAWASRKRLAATRPADERYIPIADRICEAGWFGRKTGKGYYVYDGPTPRPNPDVAAIIAQERQKAGIVPRTFSAEEIVDRYLTAMISEGARVLDEGIALRPVDIDAVFLFGYGFPRHRGGPMFYADTIGAAALVERIKTYAAQDAYFWTVPPLLERLAAEGGTFAALNAD
ncbi:3-hydroxyacyl-CoA dehydrogenase NAD-binding domain-containing protein [Acuticoccus kalidii]|uniref:3-hydroxyacyl-CoA dehydrogenase NAD-binding domain-containing protein n=1 Tax=Acuticoccus kalidii TaxID=2910977 RepID=UPI0034E257BB